MTTQQQNLHSGRAPQSSGVFFGVPLGDLGLISSLLMAFSLGFLSFFLFTFLGIVGIAIFNGMGHQMDYAWSYKYFSFPAACVMLAISLVFFGSLWLRRKISRG